MGRTGLEYRSRCADRLVLLAAAKRRERCIVGDGFENTVVTNEAAHSGQYSLKFNIPAGRATHDGYVGTKLIPFANLDAGDINAGDSVRISVWVKASGLVPDSAAAHPENMGGGNYAAVVANTVTMTDRTVKAGTISSYSRP